MEEKEKKVLNLIQKSNTYKLVIPKEVESKIRYICNKVWDVEWSGTLFYTYKGSFEEDNLEIICKNIFVMDIGTQGYTEFDMSPEVITYMTENPELLDCQMGLIHSHNNMATFFSTTDTTTLKDEGADRNNFVSLIVNNAGTYSAAITRKVKSYKEINDCYSYEFFGEGVKEHCINYNTESEEIEYYKLDIIKEGYDFNELDNRLNTIKQIKQNKPNYIRHTPKNTLPDLFSPKEGHIPIYDNVHCSKKVINSLVAQIISGCIVVSNNKFDINKWANNMNSIYDKRFNGDMAIFAEWADTYIDFIIWNAEDISLDKSAFVDESEINAVVASDVMEALKKLPKNKYLNCYIDILNKFVGL